MDLPRQQAGQILSAAHHVKCAAYLPHLGESAAGLAGSAALAGSTGLVVTSMG